MQLVRSRKERVGELRRLALERSILSGDRFSKLFLCKSVRRWYPNVVLWNNVLEPCEASHAEIQQGLRLSDQQDKREVLLVGVWCVHLLLGVLAVSE